MAGKKIACTASTEPDVGSDPRGIKTRVRETESGLVVNGAKQWISNATVCDVMNVTCRLVKDDGSSTMVRVLVDPTEFRSRRGISTCMVFARLPWEKSHLAIVMSRETIFAQILARPRSSLRLHGWPTDPSLA